MTVLLALAWTAGMAGAPVRISAGAAAEDITPEPSVANWVTGKPFGAVLDPLLVQALALNDGDNRVVIVRWDLVDVSESARDEVRKAIGARLAIPDDHILVHASHTHSAPWAPVYAESRRGKERNTWWSIRYMKPQDAEPAYARWKMRLIEATVKAAERAAANAKPATIAIGRVDIGEFLYNRRPRVPGWGMADPTAKSRMNNGKGEWVPEVLLAGTSFGPIDRTMTVVLFQDDQHATLASLLHLACHPVAIYPENANRVSADWPGFLRQRLGAPLGAESLFLQGCAGDVTPSWARGVAATEEATRGLADKAALAARYRAEIVPGKLTADRVTIALPLTTEAKQRLGTDTVEAEVQAIVCGPLAIVALPGEPLSELGFAIRDASPFPQTLVLGYANGNGVHYVGMPGEKALGGYEAGRAGAGTDECGALLVRAAGDLLRDLAGRSGAPPAAFGPPRDR